MENKINEVVIEKREMTFENKSNEDMFLSGYAATFNQPTILYKFDGVELNEVILPSAFEGANMKDCCLKYNHSNNVPILARTRGGSLSLISDEYGLRFDANLFNTSGARDVYTLVKQGGLDKCSFAFTIAEGGQEYDPKTRTNTITKIEKLWDVSIVDNPAYESTSVSARSVESFLMDIEKERLDKRKNEERLKKLKLKSEIERRIL